MSQLNKDEIKECLQGAIERYCETGKTKGEYKEYIVPLQGHKFRMLMNQEELNASIEYTIYILEELKQINENGVSRNTLLKLNGEMKEKYQEWGTGFHSVMILKKVQTDRLVMLMEEIEAICKVGGAYQMLLAHPSFASAVYAVFEHLIDAFDDEELYLQSAFFLLRAIFKINSDEIFDSEEES